MYCFVPIDASKQPFNKYVYEHRYHYDNFYVFNGVSVIRTAFYCMLNLKKHFNKEVYFRDFSHNEFLGKADDFFFSFDLIRNGFRGFKSFNFILKDMVGERYSLLSKDNEERNRLINEVFRTSFAEEGLNSNESRTKFYRLLKKKYSKESSIIMIPKNDKNFENEFF